MHMNVKPIPTLDPRINEIRALTEPIVNCDILPNERKLWAGYRDEERRNGRMLRESIKEKAAEKDREPGLLAWSRFRATDWAQRGALRAAAESPDRS